MRRLICCSLSKSLEITHKDDYAEANKAVDIGGNRVRRVGLLSGSRNSEGKDAGSDVNDVERKGARSETNNVIDTLGGKTIVRGIGSRGGTNNTGEFGESTLLVDNSQTISPSIQNSSNVQVGNNNTMIVHVKQLQQYRLQTEKEDMTRLVNEIEQITTDYLSVGAQRAFCRIMDVYKDSDKRRLLASELFVVMQKGLLPGNGVDRRHCMAEIRQWIDQSKPTENEILGQKLMDVVKQIESDLQVDVCENDGNPYHNLVDIHRCPNKNEKT